ncbi:hypothetical protein RYZ20_03470 [Thioclava sp. A2]|uniref:DUF2946 family protein n=1 Tax=Thioclava sp. FCG-A2 TaxID=3080562 RepID=UPI0029545A0F|nr:DUF2946 family protein [Thioclava sp. A2]MDV7269955.1 hypothetical protein [Thioclava sp. A2]
MNTASKPASQAAAPLKGRSPALLRGVFAWIAAMFSARSLAITAMLFQILLATDHLGATAARSIGRGEAEARLGLLQICTGEGVIWVTPDGRPVQAPTEPATSKTASCAVCSSASVCSFDDPSEVSVALAAAPVIVPVAYALVDQHIPAQARSIRPEIRGPPLA